MHSTVSTGKYAPRMIRDMAMEIGLDAVIFSDSLLRLWSYGVPPLRDIFKYQIRGNDVLGYGVRLYHQEILALNNGQDDVILVPGVEAAPFYYWRRPPWHWRGGQIRAWQRHLLIFGMSDPQGYEKLSLLEFDAYEGDAGAAPYQRVINEAKAAGGMVFWAHPASMHSRKHGRVEDFTEPYPHLLKLTQNYDGIALTYLGYLQYLEPGGLWDQLQQMYVDGRRDKPVWLIGELDFRDNRRKLDKVTTVVMTEGRSDTALLEAIRKGRMWAVFQREEAPTEMLSFNLKYGFGGKEARSGDSVPRQQIGFIQVTGRRGLSADTPTEIKLIRSGEVVGSEIVYESEFDVKWRVGPWDDPAFYRVVLDDNGTRIFSNPIFVGTERGI